MDACTVAAPDAITAFAVPNPNCSSQGSQFFRVWWLDKLPRRVDHSAYFGLANLTWVNPFSRRQFHRLLLLSRECSDVRHKTHAHLCIL